MTVESVKTRKTRKKKIKKLIQIVLVGRMDYVELAGPVDRRKK